MALARKPQTVYVEVASENVGTNKVVRVPNFGDAVAVKCQLTPDAKGVIYTRYGLDLNNPHTLFADSSQAELFSVGNRVSFNGRTFAISAPAELMSIGDRADHCKVLLEELVVTP